MRAAFHVAAVAMAFADGCTAIGARSGFHERMFLHNTIADPITCRAPMPAEDSLYEERHNTTWSWPRPPQGCGDWKRGMVEIL